MPNRIIPKKSSVAAKVPLATDLSVGEIAINLADKKIYSKDSGGTVIELANGTVTSVSGTGTVSGLTLSGSVTTSGNLTLGGTLTLTSGQVTTALGFTPYNSTNPNGYITSSGSITGSAATLTTARTLTIGSTGKTFNGSANVSWTVGEIGALSSSISQTGGKSYVTHDFNTYPSLYDVTFVNPTGSSNLPTGMGAVMSYRFIMGAGDTASRGFDLVGAAEGSGNLYIRERSIGTWSRLLHSNNYNSYAPTLTGTGASGTWGISISGNAATATNADTLDGNHAAAFALLSGATFTGGLKEAKVAMAANDVNLNSGNYFTKTISGVTTLTVSNVPATGTVAAFVLDLTNGGSGTITWWSGMKWVAGTAPTLTTSGRDVLAFFTHDGGTTWSGFVLGKDVK